MKHKVLGEAEINRHLVELSDWQVVEGELKASFTLPTFETALAFIAEVGKLAEEMNHHPTFTCSYTTVSFSYCTHDAGNKITDTDVRMAKEISQFAKRHR